MTACAEWRQRFRITRRFRLSCAVFRTRFANPVRDFAQDPRASLGLARIFSSNRLENIENATNFGEIETLLEPGGATRNSMREAPATGGGNGEN